MNIKKISIGLGILLIILALFTVIPNTLIGRYGIFYTDLVHNLLHFFLGVALIVIAYAHEDYLPRSLRRIGLLFLALAVIGAMTSGSSMHGSIYGIISANFADNILNLALAIIFIILGTREIRFPVDRNLVEDDVSLE